MALLVLLFVVAPIAELAVIVKVAGAIGVFNTLGLLLAFSIVGAWLAKQAGLGALRRIQAAVARGEVPNREMADGALILLAAALMIVPGFISDGLAVLLLLPPTRAAVRQVLLRSLANRATVTLVGARRARQRADRAGARPGTEVWDVESWEEPPRPGPQGELRGPT